MPLTVTKTARTIIAAGTSNASGATTTGTVVNLTTKLGGWLTVKITNGATGPTVAASAYVYTSHNNVDFKLAYTLTATGTNGAVHEWGERISEAVMYLRVDISGNTVQPVTCEAFLQELALA